MHVCESCGRIYPSVNAPPDRRCSNCDRPLVFTTARHAGNLALALHDRLRDQRQQLEHEGPR